MNWHKTQLLNVRTQDPRHVGDSGFGYGVQIAPLVILNSGKVVSPVVQVKRARKGFMDRVYYVQQPQEPLLTSKHLICVPVDDRIAEYIFLLNALDEKSDLRVFKFKGQMAETKTLDLPDVLTLPLLKDYENHDALWGEFQRAEQAYKNSGYPP